MLDKLFALLFGPEPDGPFVSAAGFMWRFVDRRFRRRLNAMLAKGYRKTSSNPNPTVIHGYWPVNRILMYTWLDTPQKGN